MVEIGRQRLPDQRIITDGHLDTGVAQRLDTVARHTHIGIKDTDDNRTDASCDNRFRARTSAAVMTARFQRDIQRGSASTLARLIECNNLGVTPTGLFGRTLTDNHTLFVYDHGANPGIGRCAATHRPCELVSATHHVHGF
jgi:hypothetical protein